MIWDRSVSLLQAAARGAARRRARPALVALATAELVAAQALAPLGALSLNWMVRGSGRYAVTNADLVRFGLSFAGVATLLAAGTITFALAGLARAAALLALHHVDRTGSASGVAAFLRALRHAGPLAHLGVRKALLSMRVALPYLVPAAGVVWLTVRGADLYWLVNVRPPRFWIGLACIVPLGVLCAHALLRCWMGWTIAEAMCVIRGMPAPVALRESTRTLGAQVWPIACARLGWVIAAGAAGTVVLLAARSAGAAAMSLSGSEVRIASIVAGAVLLGYGIVSFVLVLLAALGDALIVDSVWRQFDSVRGAETALPAPVESRGWRRLQRAVLVLLVVGGAAAGAGSAGLLESARRPIRTEITAHRGASRIAPENTVAAIRAAVALGVDRVELDVMLSSDGQLVVFHDNDLRRIAGDPRRVADMSFDALRAIDVGSWFDPSFAGERMPTLGEAFDAVGERGALNIELKSSGGDEDVLAARVAEVLRARGAGVRDVVVTSLSPRALRAMRQAGPKVRIGLIVAASVGDLRRMEVDFLSVEAGIATPSFLNQIAMAGLPVHVWGVTDRARFLRLALSGVEGIITSEAETALRWRSELEELTEIERLLLGARTAMISQESIRSSRRRGP